MLIRVVFTKYVDNIMWHLVKKIIRLLILSCFLTSLGLLLLFLANTMGILGSYRPGDIGEGIESVLLLVVTVLLGMITLLLNRGKNG